MTREEAIKTLKSLDGGLIFVSERVQRACCIAIKSLEQEPKYCDRNICLKNEYNNIGCDECEVGNPCLYCKHDFEPQERSE